VSSKTQINVSHDAGDPIYEELRVIRDEIQEVLGVLTFIASDPVAVERQMEGLRAFFGAGSRRAEVFLALDANRNVSDIADMIGMKRPNVSREIQRLQERQLVVPLTSAGRGAVWVPNPTLERVLHLSQKLRQWYPPRCQTLRVSPEVDGPVKDELL
jgi:predicted transcriptional regulator